MSKRPTTWLVIAASIVFCLTIIGAHPASADSVTVDDGVTSGSSFFTYTGASWTICGGCNSTATNGSYRYAYTAGDKAVLTFTGTQASIYGFREPPGGIGSFVVDNGPATDVDYYAGTQTLSAVFTTPVLSNGTHTVTVTVTGRKISGRSPTINIDKAIISSAGTTPPPQTTSVATTPTQTTPVSSSPATSSGLASITFDDGTIGQYNYGRPALLQRSLQATFYIISDALGWTGTNMNATQVRQLATDGDEIGNHTRDHSNLSTLSAAQVNAEFTDSQSAIASAVGVTPTTCAFPYGSHNSTVDSVARNFFRGCRETGGGLNMRSALRPYALTTFYVVQTTTAAGIRNAAEQAKTQNAWVIFTYHGVNPSGTGAEDVTPAHLAEQLDALRSTGIPVVTVSQALSAYGY